METTTKLTKDDILQKVSSYFNVNPDDFFTSSRGKERMAFMRQAYTYCLWLFTDLNQKEISLCIYRERSCDNRPDDKKTMFC